MEAWLSSILARIAAGDLLPPDYFAGLDGDSALNARDSDEVFGAGWTRLSEEVHRRWIAEAVPQRAQALADAIRRESFLAVSRATRQHEIASYVSDDFDLIIRGQLTDVTDLLLAQLWGVYERGEFPTPPL